MVAPSLTNFNCALTPGRAPALQILLMSMWRYREWKVVVPRMQRDGSVGSLGGGSDWNPSLQMGVAGTAGGLEKSGSGWGVETEEGDLRQGGGKGQEQV